MTDTVTHQHIDTGNDEPPRLRARDRILVSFLLGFLGCVKIRIIGSLGLNEVILIGLLPFFASRAWKLISVREYLIIMALGSCYFGSQIVTDLVVGSAPGDFMRGWSKIAITLISVLFIPAITCSGRLAATMFALGYALSPLGSLAIYGVTTEFYKFYLGMPISGATFLLYGYAPRRLRSAALILPIGAGAVALWQNSRSLAAMTILAAMICVVPGGKTHAFVDKLFSVRKMKQWFVRFCLLGAGAVGLYGFYGLAAPRGWLGERAKLKYENQLIEKESGNLGFLAGREELFYTWPKIVSSPLLGHGSWVKDYEYVQMRSAELGVPLHQPDEDIEAGVIPSHSHIFGAWLEAGLMGAVFWSIILGLCFIVLMGGLPKREGAIGPIMTFFIIMFMWDLLFSPYGAERRMWNGFMIGWLCMVYAKNRNSFMRSIDTA